MFVSVSPFLYHVTASAVTISSGTQAEKPFVNTSYISKVSSNSCCETGSLSALMTASAIQHSGLFSRFGWHHRSTTGTLVRVGFTPGKIIPSSRTYLLWRSTFHFLLGTWLEIANDLYILPFSWSFVLLWQVHIGLLVVQGLAWELRHRGVWHSPACPIALSVPVLLLLWKTGWGCRHGNREIINKYLVYRGSLCKRTCRLLQVQIFTIYQALVLFF